MSPAPIALFVYNRPGHTRLTIEALSENLLATKSELYIFSDAAKGYADAEAVREVRRIAHSVSGFKKVVVTERPSNWGLARSIVDGVNWIMAQFGRGIILEDDVVTSRTFLKFMNDALNFYRDEPRVWHISGWSYPISTDALGDIFFWRVMNCWGWATWADRWEHYRKDAHELVQVFDKDMIRDFDLDNIGVFWQQVVDNYRGRIDTWAIFWYASIYLNGGLCVSPSNSYVRNIGHDGSGVHCGVSDHYEQLVLNEKEQADFDCRVEESEVAVGLIRQYYMRSRVSWWSRATRKTVRLISRMSAAVASAQKHLNKDG